MYREYVKSLVQGKINIHPTELFQKRINVEIEKIVQSIEYDHIFYNISAQQKIDKEIIKLRL